MYIEVLHDANGNIMSCYCADTLPVAEKSPFFVMENAPEDLEQARVNIDTMAAMEIDLASAERAELDPATGAPVIVRQDRSRHIIDNYVVDTEVVLTPPPGISMPEGMKFRRIVKK